MELNSGSKTAFKGQNRQKILLKRDHTVSPSISSILDSGACIPGASNPSRGCYQDIKPQQGVTPSPSRQPRYAYSVLHSPLTGGPAHHRTAPLFPRHPQLALLHDPTGIQAAHCSTCTVFRSPGSALRSLCTVLPSRTVTA